MPKRFEFFILKKVKIFEKATGVSLFPFLFFFQEKRSEKRKNVNE